MQWASTHNAQKRIRAVALGGAVILGGARGGKAVSRGAQVELIWIRQGEARVCIDDRAVRQAVERRLGRPVFSDKQAPDLRVRGTLQRSSNPPAWRVAIQVETPTGELLGERTLSAPGRACSALDESLALVLALLLDRTVDTEETAAPIRAVPIPADPPTPLNIPGPQLRNTELVRPQSALSPEAHSPSPRWRLEGGAGLQAAYGTATPSALGPVLWMALIPPHFPRIHGAYTGWLPGEVLRANAGARFSQSAVSLELCPRLVAWSRQRWEICFGQRLTRIHSQGFGYDIMHEYTRIALGTQGDLRWWWQPTHLLRVGLGLGAVLGMVRDRYVYRSLDGAQNSLRDPPRLTSFIDFSLGLAFR